MVVDFGFSFVVFVFLAVDFLLLVDAVFLVADFVPFFFAGVFFFSSFWWL